MIIKELEDLKKYSSFRIGGLARKMFIPENINELISLTSKFGWRGYHLIGNGTNVLFTDGIVDKPIINLKKIATNISVDHDGIEVGASFDLRKFISYCVENELNVPVHLATIPGSIGGAIYMNAARGGGKGQISDGIISVKCLRNGKIVTLNKNDCLFGYRDSVFHKNNDIILSARFKYQKISRELAQKHLKDALVVLKEKDYFKYPSAGSVFKKYNHAIMRLLKGLRIGNAKYSSKDINSIINLGNAKFIHVMTLINIARVLHLLLLQKCRLEIIIFKK